MTEFFTAADGARLAYTDTGSGPALLCLAGLTRTRADFDYLLPHLPAGRVILMDYRGRGDSAWTGAASYTVLQEAQDVIGLLDHLGVAKVAILGTSRGGLIGLVLAAMAKHRLRGLCLNDVGPVIERSGLERIFDYVGRNPAAKSHVDMAERLARANPGFEGVSAARWLSEAQHHYQQTDQGLKINYDPALREAFLAAFDGPAADAWPLFDALAGLPVALIRGANTDLLSKQTVAEMQRRRPDMIYAEIPGRAHVPFLDEPESLAAVRAFLEACP